MKEFSKEEYNKLCAEFLGFKTNREKSHWKVRNTTCSYFKSIITDKDGGFLTEALRFDTDWNWIIRVVEKIEETYDEFHGYFGVHINSNNCTIQGTKLRLDPENPHYVYFNDVVLNNKKEATVIAIWQFLNWYKEHGKSN